MGRWATIAAVALAVYLVLRPKQADAGDSYVVNDWATLPGYSAGSGVIL